MQREYKTPLSYLSSLYSDDIQLSQAIKVVGRYGKAKIFEAYYEAKHHESTKQNFTLTTAHSAKGLEFDEVTIAQDLNDSVAPVIAQLDADPESFIDSSQRESLNLYYVAITRCTKSLINAEHI